MKIVEANQDFGITLSLSQGEFAKDDIVHDSIDCNSRTSSFKEGGTYVGSQAFNVQWLIDSQGSRKSQTNRLVLQIS